MFGYFQYFGADHFYDDDMNGSYNDKFILILWIMIFINTFITVFYCCCYVNKKLNKCKKYRKYKKINDTDFSDLNHDNDVWFIYKKIAKNTIIKTNFAFDSVIFGTFLL